MVWPWRLAAVIAVPQTLPGWCLRVSTRTSRLQRSWRVGSVSEGCCKQHGKVHWQPTTCYDENGVRAILVHAGDGRKIGMILPHWWTSENRVRNPLKSMSILKLLQSIKEFIVFFPQQRKLMGSSAQNSSGVHWCRPRVRFNEVLEKVPNVPEKVGAEPGQVQQGSREGSEEGLGGFGAEPGQVQRSRADLETKTADSETNRHADSETNGHAHSETQLRPDSETNVRKPKLTFGNLNLHDQSHLMHQVIK